MGTLRHGLAAMGMLGALVSGSRAETAGLLFHLPFDGSTEAAKAIGRAAPIVAEGVKYSDGASGQAISIGADTTLEYASEGNLVQEHGTVMLWYRPNWRAAEMDDLKQSDWHTLFQQRLDEGERIGSGQLWLWFWGPMLRGDIADSADMYKIASPSGLDSSTWAHVALTWDVERGSQLYMNGMLVGSASDGASPLKLAKGGNYKALTNRFSSFYVGSAKGWQRADGLIDDFRVYDRVLETEEITAEMAATSPLRIDCLSSFVTEGTEKTQIRWNLTNISQRPEEGSCKWKFVRPTGEVVAEGQTPEGQIARAEQRQTEVSVPALGQGEYKLIVQPAKGPHRAATVWALGRGNAYTTAPGKLRTSPVETIDFVQGVAADRMVVKGETRIGELAGRKYFEAGLKKNDRFAVKVTLPEAGVPYLVEWDYPDDKLRTMEMVAQDAMNPSSDYAMQTGVFCGDEYPNSGQTLTHRSVLWARAKDTAFIFMTARADAPAAVSGLRIARIEGGLPDAGVQNPAPTRGWTRTIGIHYEDPSLGYDFGIKGQLMPGYEQTIDRLIAYMKWSGQDLLSYPAVWYHGRIGPAYQPRAHEDDFIGCILTKFETQGLGFMPAINLQNIRLSEDVTINETTMSDGSLHSSPVMILRTGKPNPGGWHGTPPNFNPMHAAVRRYVDEQIDDLLNRYASSPAFKGITLHLTKHTIPWFGSIEAGYNDYCIEAFERDTGIQVAVDRKDPLRGKLYYQWLMANAREQWVQWRCEQIAKWYTSIAQKMAAKRPDLRLNIISYNPTVSDHASDPRFATSEFALISNRESGIDPKLYERAQNIILAQTLYPADYRWQGKKDAKSREGVMMAHFHEGTYAIIRDAEMPWINMHDRYFEDGIGGMKWWGKNDPLQAPWLKEVSWRVSVLNANERYFIEHYVLPLRYGDVLGYTKGGFLIGTLGVEEPLREFARAFKALPAKRFADLPGTNDTTKARVLKAEDGNWFYAVNTSREAVSMSFSFEQASGTVTDLVSGQPQPWSENSLRLQLKPYELRSFRSAVGPTSVDCGGQGR